MRIISGKAKGLKLVTPPGNSRYIRPTSDRCKEALFSILDDKIINAKILDLYAGTGSFGLEALSRGAKSAVFVDNNKTSLSLIKKNVTKLEQCFDSHSTIPLISIIKSVLPKGLDYALNILDDQKIPFDIIFLDPPYAKGLIKQTLKKLAASIYLAESCIIITEGSSKSTMPDVIDNLRLYDFRRYGDTGFWFFIN